VPWSYESENKIGLGNEYAIRSQDTHFRRTYPGWFMDWNETGWEGNCGEVYNDGDGWADGIQLINSCRY